MRVPHGRHGCARPAAAACALASAVRRSSPNRHVQTLAAQPMGEAQQRRDLLLVRGRHGVPAPSRAPCRCAHAAQVVLHAATSADVRPLPRPAEVRHLAVPDSRAEPGVHMDTASRSSPAAGSAARSAFTARSKLSPAGKKAREDRLQPAIARTARSSTPSWRRTSPSWRSDGWRSSPGRRHTSSPPRRREPELDQQPPHREDVDAACRPPRRLADRPARRRWRTT